MVSNSFLLKLMAPTNDSSNNKVRPWAERFYPELGNWILMMAALKPKTFYELTMKNHIMKIVILFIALLIPAFINLGLRLAFALSPVWFFISTLLTSLIVSFFIYFLLYLKHFKLKISVLSFVSVYFIITEFMFYIQIIIFTLLYELPNPIYLENISIISQYRYLVLLILGICSVVYLVINNFIPQFYTFTNKYNFPYVKEEIANLIHASKNNLLPNLCIELTTILHNSLFFRRIFFLVHFCLLDLIRFIRLIFFANFCFFHGDLRYLVYLTSLSFLAWLLRFLDYYLIWLIKANLTTINELAHTSYRNPDLMISQRTDDKGFTNVKDPREIVFTWSNLALERGFNDDDLPEIVSTWFKLNNVLSILKKHQIRLTYSYYIMLGFYIICWVYLVYFFFGPNPGPVEVLVVFPIFSKAFLRINNSAILLARDARFLPEKIQNKLRGETKAYSPGHAVYGEEKSSGEYVVEGSLTQGPGTKDHPSFPLRPTPVDSNARKQGEQCHIPFGKGKEITLPPGATHPAIPGSSKALESPDVKAQLDQN